MGTTNKLVLLLLCLSLCFGSSTAFHSRLLLVSPIHQHPHWQAKQQQQGGGGGTRRNRINNEAAPLPPPKLAATRPNNKVIIKRKQLPPPPQKVYLTHERDFFRQETRLQSMDSYVLVSTLIASISFDALLNFQPSAASRSIFHIQGRTAKFLYNSVCLAIQVVSGLSALCGLYGTLVFSLTILYGKSALGAERDIEYDEFLRSTVRCRVHGFRCFTYSLGLFGLLAMLLLVERTSFRACSIPVMCTASYILYRLYKDWTLLFEKAEIIYKATTGQ